jgi:hypothetical protein
MAHTQAEKDQVESVAQALIQMTGEFCAQHLDCEYERLCKQLILKMKRKRQPPFLGGRLNTWAAGVIYALGQINFLFDHDTQPYVSPDQIAEHFGVSKRTVGQKAKQIRDMFSLSYWHPEFSTQEVLASNPCKNMVVIDGFIVPVEMLEPEVREELRRRGVV